MVRLTIIRNIKRLIEQKAVIDKLTDEQAGKLIKAIYEYVATGNTPQLDMTIDLVITPFITTLDKNKEKYEATCKKRAEAGAKGGKQKVANASKCKQNVANVADNDNEYDNEYDNDINNIYTLSEVKTSTSGTAKASKHKYGEYKNVLLKDEELQALKDSYTNWEELIKYLDEYIEMKGYKAKSHYLAIKKWVVNAVKEKQTKGVKELNNMHKENTQFGDLSKFYIN